MTVSVQVETTIDRPPTEVFEELAAVERYPSWMVASGITAVERPAEPLAQGSRLRIRQAIAGRATVLDGSVTALEPGRRLALAGRDPDGVTIDIDAAIAPEGAGTRVRWSLRLDLPLRFRLFESMVTPQVQRAAALDLDALKRRMAGGGQVTGRTDR